MGDLCGGWALIRRLVADGVPQRLPESPEDGRPIVIVLRTPGERFADLAEFGYAPNYVDVDGGPARGHRRRRPRGSDDGVPVVLLHACSGARSPWPGGHRVIVPDLVGFGRSDKPSEISDYTYERYVSWLKSFCHEISLREVVLLGHNWGGLLRLRVTTEVHGLVGAYVASNHGYPTGDMPANDALRPGRKYAVSVEEFDTGRIVARACAIDLEPSVVAAYDAPPSVDFVRASRQVLAEAVFPSSRCTGSSTRSPARPTRCSTSWRQGSAGQRHARLVQAGHNVPEDTSGTLGELVAEFAQILPVTR